MRRMKYCENDEVIESEQSGGVVLWADKIANIHDFHRFTLNIQSWKEISVTRLAKRSAR
jgi:hypothetical protein